MSMKTRIVQVTSAFGEAKTADGAKETLILKSHRCSHQKKRKRWKEVTQKRIFSHFYLNCWFVFGLCRIM